MKKTKFILGLLVLTIFGGLYAKCKFYDPKYRLENARTEVKKLADQHEIKNGDLIFQTSLSVQSNAIQLATKSKYSHCGLIYKDATTFMFLRRFNQLSGHLLTNGLPEDKAVSM